MQSNFWARLPQAVEDQVKLDAYWDDGLSVLVMLVLYLSWDPLRVVRVSSKCVFHQICGS